MTDQTTTVALLGTTGAPTLQDRPRIYVACLAAYNNARLHGRWIEAATPDEIRAEVRAMLAASPVPDAEEWAIHDYEGFEGAHLSEYASFETVCELAEFIGEYGELAAASTGITAMTLSRRAPHSKTMRASTAALPISPKSCTTSSAPQSPKASATISTGRHSPATWR